MPGENSGGSADQVEIQARKMVAASHGTVSLEDARTAVLQRLGGSTATDSQWGGSYVFLGGYQTVPGVGGAGGAFFTGGRADSDATRGERGYTTLPSRAPVRLTLDQSNDWLIQQYETHSKDYERIRQEMLDAGLIKPGSDITDMLNVWEQYSKLSYSAGKFRGGLMTPEDYIKARGSLNNDGVPHTTTETSTTTTLHNKADLAAAYQQTSEQALGRRATPGEAAAAAGTVKALADRSPDRATTVRTVNAAGTSAVSRTTQNPGMGSAAIDEALLEQAMANPQYGEYQAAGVYFPVLAQAIAAVNQAGA